LGVTFKVGDKVRLTGVAWIGDGESPEPGSVHKIVGYGPTGDPWFLWNGGTYHVFDSSAPPSVYAAWGAELLERTPETESDAVNPDHYKTYPVEVIEITEHMNFNRGNAVKYIARAGLKHPSTEIEDLRKAKWYIEREIARMQNG
jgi:hypothetical protein